MTRLTRPNEERDREILRRKIAGESGADLARAFRISYGRVIDICDREKRRASKEKAFRGLSPETRFEEVPSSLLSCRLHNAMRFLSCSTIGDVAKLSEQQLRKQRNLGTASLAELDNLIDLAGIRTGVSPAARIRRRLARVKEEFPR
jgi:DNA-directed RNA polymerase alpha subunit